MMDRKIFLALVAFAALLLYLFLFYAVIAPYLRPLTWAAIIGVATFPLYRRLHRRLGQRDLLSASLMTPAVLFILVVPAAVLVFFMAKEATELYQLLTAEGNSSPITLESLRKIPIVQSAMEWVRPYLEKLDLDLRQILRESTQRAMSFLVSTTTGILKDSLSFSLKLTLTVLTLFFIYKDGEKFQDLLLNLLGLDAEIRKELVQRIKTVLAAVIYGVFLTCIAQGILGGIGYWIADIPSPLLFGVMTGIAALIPVVGTALVWVPAGLYLLFAGHLIKGIFLLAWGGLVIGAADNLIRPLAISGRGHISLFVVALGLLGGLAAFGIIGVVAGPLLLSLLFPVLDVFRKHLFT